MRASCRPKVFVWGKAEFTEIPSAGQRPRTQPVASAWETCWPCSARSTSARAGPGSGAGRPRPASPNAKIALSQASLWPPEPIPGTAGPVANGMAKEAERRGRRSWSPELAVN